MKTPQANPTTIVAQRPPHVSQLLFFCYDTPKKKNLYLTFFFLFSLIVCLFPSPLFCLAAFYMLLFALFFFFPTRPLVAVLFRLHLSELAPKSKHYTECQWQDNGLFVAALLNTVMLMLDPLRPSVLHWYIPANMCFRILMCWFFTAEQKSRLRTLCIELFFPPNACFFSQLWSLWKHSVFIWLHECMTVNLLKWLNAASSFIISPASSNSTLAF